MPSLDWPGLGLWRSDSVTLAVRATRSRYCGFRRHVGQLRQPPSLPSLHSPEMLVVGEELEGS